MHDQFGTLADAFEIGGLGGVTADAERTPLVIEPVADGRLYRIVIDLECGYRQSALGEDHGAISGHLEWARLCPATRRRRNFFAVMGGPIAVVGCIGSVEAGYHGLKSCRPIDGKRCRLRAAHPVIEHQRAKSVDMIGMEMRQEKRIDVSGTDPHHRQVPGTAFADVDYENAFPCNYDIARPRTVGVRHWRTRSAQTQMQPVFQRCQTIAPVVLLDCALEHGRADLCLEQDCCENAQHHHSRQDQYCFL